jgi:hypothetical protein
MNDTSRDQRTGPLPIDPPRTGFGQAAASSYVSQGPEWWQASDHKWYPPQHHPHYVAPEPSPSSRDGRTADIHPTSPTARDAFAPHVAYHYFFADLTVW